MGLFDKFQKESSGTIEETRALPFLSLLDIVVFPGATIPLYIMNPQGQRAVEISMAGDRRIIVGYPRSGQTSLHLDSMSPIATEARLVQVMKLPNNTSRVLIEGLRRVHLRSLETKADGNSAGIEALTEDNTLVSPVPGLVRALQDEFETYSKSNKRVVKEILSRVQGTTNPNLLSDLVCGSLSSPYSQRLEVFLSLDTKARLEKTLELIRTETEVLDLRKEVTDRVKKRMEEGQKEYFIQEQIKEMNKALGKEEDDDPSGLKELERRLAEKSLSKEVDERFRSEYKRLSRLQSFGPEAGILRTYLEWILDLPWPTDISQTIQPSLAEAQSILDSHHFGMTEVKERILDFLAVRILRPDLRAPILCFVGPPGTGKTSLGKSLAEAMGRSFVRMSLGGVRDEAEIRGHRRTYIGALPGKIIQGMKKAGTQNPVFLLDEIDKISADHRGDPSSALLEVLDPEQNNTFADHYLELPFDLSQVVFLTTANSLHTIPLALRDRMEIIQIPGYTENEKVSIASEFLFPRQFENHGLVPKDIRLSPETLKYVIRNYTMESGVRALDREVAKILRKVAREKAETQTKNKLFSYVLVNPRNLEKFLGKPRHLPEHSFQHNPPGFTYGLAWTEVGGKILPIESAGFEGKGNLLLTGSLGDVMKESARIALTLIRQRAKDIGLGDFDFGATDLHIHVPEGAIPKDGPSAGIGLTVSLVSALKKCSIPIGLALTGEITLTGRVLAIGGLKEKLLAAHRNALTQVIIPKENERDLEELPVEVRKALTIDLVETIDEVFKLTGLLDLP